MEICVEGVGDGLPVVGTVNGGGLAGLAVKDGQVMGGEEGCVLEVVGVFDGLERGVVSLGKCECDHQEESG